MFTEASTSATKPNRGRARRRHQINAHRQQRADDDHRGNRVGDRHQRRVQRRRHRPDHIVADENRQHENRKPEDERIDRAAGLRHGPPPRHAIGGHLGGDPRSFRCSIGSGRAQRLPAPAFSRASLIYLPPFTSAVRLRIWRPQVRAIRRLEVMNDSAIMGQRGRLDQFVLPIDSHRLGFLVDQSFDRNAAGSSRRAEMPCRDPAWHVQVADTLARRHRAISPATAPSTLPPRSTARSTKTEPGFMRLSMSLRHQLGRRAPRNECRGDDDVLLGDMGSDKLCLLGFLIVVGHFLGVAASGLRLLELIVFDRDELGAQRFHLLLGSRANIGCGHHSPRRRAVAIA
jgi:hypothetical protein